MSEAGACTAVAWLISADFSEIRRGYVSDLLFLPGDAALSLWSKLTEGPGTFITGTCPSAGSAVALAIGLIVWACVVALVAAVGRKIGMAVLRRRSRSKEGPLPASPPWPGTLRTKAPQMLAPAASMQSHANAANRQPR